MIINHNMNAMNAHRLMTGNTASAGKSMEKLSSGLRINRAGDDAAGLAISEKMRAQIKGLDQASRNAQDGISMIQTAEGALNETHSILQRMRELADQSANGTNTSLDRDAIQTEITQLKSEIDRIGNTTEFNTQKLLNGSLKTNGATTAADNTTGAVVAKLNAATLVGSNSINGVKATTANFVKETITIDGTNIDVNWQNLTNDQRTTLTGVGTDPTSRNNAKDLIINTINAAIDASGANVAHVTGYINTSGSLVIKSGEEGDESNIITGAITNNATGVLNRMTGIDNNSAVTTAGSGGWSKYNGTTVAANDLFNFKIGSLSLQASMDTAITGNTTYMSSAAVLLESNINVQISAYNTLQNKTAGQDGYIQKIKVNATDDGRFQVISESGPVTFTDKDGKTTVKDLGLTQAQTDSAGNGGMTFQIGANKGQTLQFGINDMRTTALGVGAIDASTATGASAALSVLDTALSKVSTERAKLGAVQNRLEHTIANLGTSSENLTSAESRIRDVDMAKEMMTFSKNNILSQAAQAMLAQANQQPQGVLQLLR